MSIRRIIRKYLERHYHYLMVNDVFKSWLYIWFDRENQPMDLYEFYYMIAEIPVSGLLVYETVKINSYNPTGTFEENLKEVEKSMKQYRQDFQHFLDEENENIDPIWQTTQDSFSDEEIREMMSEGPIPTKKDIEKSKKRMKDWLDSLGK